MKRLGLTSADVLLAFYMTWIIRLSLSHRRTKNVETKETRPVEVEPVETTKPAAEEEQPKPTEAIPPAERNPIAALAEALEKKWPVPPAYGAWKFGLWVTPCALLVLVGILLPQTAQTLVFTAAGAFASIQLVKPYQMAERRTMNILRELEKDERSPTSQGKSTLRFFFTEPRTLGTTKSYTNFGYLIAQLRFRRIARRWEKRMGKTVGMTRLGGVGPYWGVDDRTGPLATDKGKKRASRTLSQVGRELLKATGKINADECVETTAKRYDIKYRTTRR